MYKLIKATTKHAKQIVPYLTITCYWKEFVEGNKLNQSYEEFMLEWIVNPRLPFITVLVKEGEEDTVLGCVTTATTEDFAKMPDYTPHLHPRVMEIFKPWFEFSVSDSVVVELIAVKKELRGQGFGSKLYKVAEDLAKEKGKNCISGFIWACFPDSLINATKKGRMVTNCIHFAEPINIPLLYVEKKSEYAKLKDYFQSEEYLNTTNMLFK
jgi:GNAT superfamily N-acetyltransferase